MRVARLFEVGLVLGEEAVPYRDSSVRAARTPSEKKEFHLLRYSDMNVLY